MSVQLEPDVTVADLQVGVHSLIERLGLLSGPDASVQLHAVAKLAASVDALRVGLVNVVRASEVWREKDPNGTAASFLRQEHVVDQRHAQSDLRAAESFEEFPALASAARNGTISREKIDLILSFGRRNFARKAMLPEFIDIFIELAERVTVCELRRTLQLWADQVDPVTTAGDDRDAHSRRELYIHQLGDGFKIDGFFGHEQGLQIMTALNAALAAQWRSREQVNQGHGQTGGGPSQDRLPGAVSSLSRAASPNDGRGHSHGQPGALANPESITSDLASVREQLAPSTAIERADAFVAAIVVPMLESGLLPTSGGATATVNVTIPLARLSSPTEAASVAQLRERIADGTLGMFSAVARATNGPGEMIISSMMAQKMSCDATIQRVVLSPAGKPLDVGRRTRVIPEQIRAALLIRDGGCRFPFCQRPAGWAEGHHIQHWAQGGSTALDNLILLCSKHHHKVHSDNIPIELDSDGIPRVKLEYRPVHRN